MRGAAWTVVGACCVWRACNRLTLLSLLPPCTTQACMRPPPPACCSACKSGAATSECKPVACLGLQSCQPPLQHSACSAVNYQPAHFPSAALQAAAAGARGRGGGRRAAAAGGRAAGAVCRRGAAGGLQRQRHPRVQHPAAAGRQHLGARSPAAAWRGGSVCVAARVHRRRVGRPDRQRRRPPGQPGGRGRARHAAGSGRRPGGLPGLEPRRRATGGGGGRQGGVLCAGWRQLAARGCRAHRLG